MAYSKMGSQAPQRGVCARLALWSALPIFKVAAVLVILHATCGTYHMTSAKELSNAAYTIDDAFDIDQFDETPAVSVAAAANPNVAMARSKRNLDTESLLEDELQPFAGEYNTNKHPKHKTQSLDGKKQRSKHQTHNKHRSNLLLQRHKTQEDAEENGADHASKQLKKLAKKHAKRQSDFEGSGSGDSDEVSEEPSITLWLTQFVINEPWSEVLADSKSIEFLGLRHELKIAFFDLFHETHNDEDFNITAKLVTVARSNDNFKIYVTVQLELPAEVNDFGQDFVNHINSFHRLGNLGVEVGDRYYFRSARDIDADDNHVTSQPKEDDYDERRRVEEEEQRRDEYMQYIRNKYPDGLVNEFELQAYEEAYLAEEAERERAAQEAEERRRAEKAERQRAAQEAEEHRRAQEAERQRAAQEAEEHRRAEEAERQRAAQEAEEHRRAEEAERQRAAQEAEERRRAVYDHGRELKKMGEEILGKIEKVKLKQDGIEKVLTRILQEINSLKASGEKTNADIPTLPRIIPRTPLSSREEFLQTIEKEIETNDEKFDILVSQLKTFNAPTTYKFIKMCWKSLIDDNAAQSFWKCMETKRCVRSLTVTAAIEKAFFMKFPKSTDAEFEKVTMAYFLKAKTRFTKKHPLAF